MTSAAVPRRGRRGGNADTRGAILTAAREEFGAKGYDATSLRSIARAAGVDPALVHHYFEGKEQVFVAAMDLPFDPSVELPEILEGDPALMGERLVRLFLRVWSADDGRGPLVALLGAAITNEQAATMLRGFVSSAVLGRATAALHLPDASLRATAAAAQLVGMGVLRYVVRVEPLASVPDDAVVALIGPVVQSYLTP